MPNESNSVNLNQFLSQKGLITYNDLERQRNWLDWYEGKDKWYHYEVVTVDNRPHKLERLSMGILSRVCTDWASLLLNENTFITASDDAANTRLQTIFEETGFLPAMQQFIERYFAIGTGALVFGRGEDAPHVSFVDGTNCLVAKVRDGRPVQVVFTKTYAPEVTLVSVHGEVKGRPGQYQVQNYLVDKDGRELSLNDSGFEAQESYQHPTFLWLKPAIARRSNWSSVYGQSIFAGALDANKLLDIAFDGYANELLMGRKRIFVDQNLLTYKKAGDGVLKPAFDLRDVVFHTIPTLGGSDDGAVKDQIKEIDMTLRQSEYSNSVQDALNYVSSNCFLGNHYYEFTHETGQITATQVVSANSVLYRNLRKQENALERSLKQTAQILLALVGVSVQLTDITVKFDDSIIVDEETERDNDRQDVRDGLMSKVEYRMKWYGETREQAQEALGQIEPIDLSPEFSTQTSVEL